MGANILNIGLTQLLLGQLLCCVRGALPPPGAHSGARCPPPGGSLLCILFALRFESKVWRGRSRLRYLHAAQDGAAPQGTREGSAAAQHKRGPPLGSAPCLGGAKTGQALGHVGGEEGGFEGIEGTVHGQNKWIFLRGGVWFGQGRAKQGRARKESQRHNTIGSLFESWAGSE